MALINAKQLSSRQAWVVVCSIAALCLAGVLKLLGIV